MIKLVLFFRLNIFLTLLFIYSYAMAYEESPYNIVHQTDVYEISSDNPFNFYAGLTVPKIDDCTDFPRFSFAVLDQDFHLIQELDGQNFQWWEWYEPYGKKWYWVGPEHGEDFKSTKIFDAGTYYVKVYNKDNKGNYVLAVGDIEKFTPLVIAKTIITLPRINRKFWDKRNCV